MIPLSPDDVSVIAKSASPFMHRSWRFLIEWLTLLVPPALVLSALYDTADHINQRCCGAADRVRHPYPLVQRICYV